MKMCFKKSFFSDNDSLCIRLHHDVAVDQDGADDGEGEQGVGEDMDCNPKFKYLFVQRTMFCFIIFISNF